MTIATLIIEDDKNYATTLSRIVTKEGSEPTVVYSGEEGLKVFYDVQPALVLVDLGLPGINGIEVIKKAKELEPSVICIVVSGTANVENTVEAMRAGAFDLIQKNAGVSEIRLRLKKAFEMADLHRHITYLRDRESAYEDIVGESSVMLDVKRNIEEVAKTPSSTVLIIGETGTGKELVARAIHRLSSRSDKPMIPVNSAAIPDALLESEFFGHERGSFTGADRKKIGLFETAHGGTLFLDEIGELDLKLQAKLLRIIEEKRFARVGGTREIGVDVRLIAATNQNLDKLAEEGKFREDLIYRLNVFQIDVPLLKDRGDDILLLAHHFLTLFSKQLGKKVIGIEPVAMQALKQYDYPGNIRQLRNLMEQAMILSRGEYLTVRDFRGLSQPPHPNMLVQFQEQEQEPLDDSSTLSQKIETLEAKRQDLKNFEINLIDSALAEANGNKSKAAKLLYMNRYAFLRWIQRVKPDK